MNRLTTNRLTTNRLATNRLTKIGATLSALLVVAGALVAARPAQAANPFEEAAYLWTQGTDTDLSGDGDWGMYKSWLGVSRLGVESDPGGWDTWANTTEGWNNNHWGDQQTRYGTGALPDILLGIGTMPYSPHGYDTTWEGQQWQLEANNDPATMQHFVNLGNNIASWNYKSVIIRMDYEFDGGWDPYGNLNVIPGMPGNFIKAWQNIVNTVRSTVKAKNPNISVKFLWNPTDSNVQVWSANYYPGDAYVDYIGFDNYDYDYSGIYQSGVQPSTATQQTAWTKSILPRIQWFADFASAANPGSRNGYIAGRSVPLIVGEWGLWQVASGGRGAGGDDPTYIQNMHDWMASHNVYMESYFETPSDGVSTLWPGGFPTPGSGNPSWGTSGSPYPNASALYRTLFSDAGAVPVTNYLTNPGFETASLTGWTMWMGSNPAAAYASNNPGEAHSGSWGYVNWSSTPYELTAYQQVTVPNGSHTVSAWIKNSGGETTCQMLVKYYGGVVATVNIPASSTWQKISTTVNVTSGTLEVSFYNKAAANQWLNVDDVVVN